MKRFSKNTLFALVFGSFVSIPLIALAQEITCGEYIVEYGSMSVETIENKHSQALAERAKKSADAAAKRSQEERKKAVLARLPRAVPGSNFISTDRGGSLNVRSGPSTSTKRIMLLANGTKIKVIGSTYGWKKIQLSGGEYSFGWVSARYVGPKDNPISYDPPPSYGATHYVCTDTDNLIVRRGPGTQFSDKGEFKKGERLRVSRTASNGWRYSHSLVGKLEGWTSPDHTCPL